VSDAFIRTVLACTRFLFNGSFTCTEWHIKSGTLYTLRKYLLKHGFICVDPDTGSTEDPSAFKDD